MDVSVQEKDGKAVLELAGTIDERFKLSDWIVVPPPELFVNCKNISRINSMGVKHWTHTFDSLRKQNTKLSFFEVPLIVLEHSNYVEGFMYTTEIHSVSIGYYCENCNVESNLTQTLPISGEEFKKVVPKCPQCGSTMGLEGLDEEYASVILNLDKTKNGVVKK